MFPLDAIQFERRTYRVMENRGPVMPVLVLDKAAISEMVVQVYDTSNTATGK